MRIFFGETKKEARQLLKGNYNILVLTIFIPFLISVAAMVKSFGGEDVYEILDKMTSLNGTVIVTLANFLMSIAGIAVVYGVKSLYNNEKASLSKNYLTALSDCIRYFPSFFLMAILPTILSFLTNVQSTDKFYDSFLSENLDYIVFINAVQYVRIAINFLQFYLIISLLFVPSILIEQKEMPSFEVIFESFRLTKGRKLELFVLCLSFAGWYLLGYMAFIIGILWAIVYFNAVIYIYYKRVILQDREYSGTEEQTKDNNEK